MWTAPSAAATASTSPITRADGRGRARGRSGVSADTDSASGIEIAASLDWGPEGTMRVTAWLGASLLAASLLGCSKPASGATTVWVFDRAFTIADAPSESKEWTKKKLDEWKLDIRLELHGDN